jgi:hypothetical protein
MATKKRKKKKKNPLLAAATMLPLAIGLASNVPTAGRAPKPAAAAAMVSTIASCTLPFDDIKVHHPIDDTCGPTGKEKTATTAQALQNLAKNNFCASGVPTNIDFDVLHQLQKDADTAFGGHHALPKDRSVLRAFPTKVGPIGEGAVVRLAAFVIEAHISNKSGGESVNCKKSGEENNDIHIVLGEKSNHEAPCDSVTAEVSPHFRPDVWDADVLTQHNEHLYRFTGQLFYDASHVVCVGGTGPNPQRSSLWEIHPVYAVDICIDPGNKCTVDKDENWAPLSEQVHADTTETRLLPPAGLWNALHPGANSVAQRRSRVANAGKGPAL